MPVFNLLVSSYFLLLVPIVTFYFNSWIRIRYTIAPSSPGEIDSTTNTRVPTVADLLGGIVLRSPVALNKYGVLA